LPVRCVGLMQCACLQAVRGCLIWRELLCYQAYVLCCAVHADTLRNEFLAAYGHQHLITLTHLERAGRLMSHLMLRHSVNNDGQPDLY
jgi:hypothetical protein